LVCDGGNDDKSGYKSDSFGHMEREGRRKMWKTGRGGFDIFFSNGRGCSFFKRRLVDLPKWNSPLKTMVRPFLKRRLKVFASFGFLNQSILKTRCL
jgi:hypothetical protein